MTLIQTWTSQKLVKFGLWLAGALGFGLDTAQPTATQDTWTADSLTKFGLEMSKGFGVEL